jgi:hypothetical protein
MSSIPGTGLSDELSLYKKGYNAKSRERLDLQGWLDDLVVMRVALCQKKYEMGTLGTPAWPGDRK